MRSNNKHGFTLIELLITITIMAVLLTLTVVSLRSSQAHARDEERKTDVSVIAQALENYYNVGSDDYTTYEPQAPIARLANTGMPEVKLAATWGNPLYVKGYYPPTGYFTDEAAIRQALRDIEPAALRAPGVAESSAPSLVGATSTAVPSPNTSTYVYQPLKADGSLCTQAQTSTNSDNLDKCRSFTLYYKLETVSEVQKITSKHQ